MRSIERAKGSHWKTDRTTVLVEGATLELIGLPWVTHPWTDRATMTTHPTRSCRRLCIEQPISSSSSQTCCYYNQIEPSTLSSISLSLSLSLSLKCLVWCNKDFFLFYFLFLWVYILIFFVIIFVWKLGKCVEMLILISFWKFALLTINVVLDPQF